MIDYKEIETRWQKAWTEAKIFEGEVGGKPSYMVTAAWPYVNTPLHIGHLRTFGTADVLARYKRMRGFKGAEGLLDHPKGRRSGQSVRARLFQLRKERVHNNEGCFCRMSTR